jgi:flagellar biosynthesis component FlhA
VSLRENLVRGADENALSLPAALSGPLLEEIRDVLARVETGATAPIVLVADDIRWPLFSFLRANGLEIAVLAFHEITGEFTFSPVGTVTASTGRLTDVPEDLAA